jgi:2-isopropylmalate synthase
MNVDPDEHQARVVRRAAHEQLARLTETAHFIDELLNRTPDPDQAYVGKNAFAHKGGMHVAGVNADPATFEHIDPAAVGNAREVLVSELSGQSNVLWKAREYGFTDVDGSQPDAWRYLVEVQDAGLPADTTGYR